MTFKPYILSAAVLASVAGFDAYAAAVAGPCAESRQTYPVNNYPGLNRLRERLGQHVCHESEPLWPETSLPQPSAKSDATQYLADILGGQRPIGTPVTVYFKDGSTILATQTQAEILDVMARVVRTHRLKIKIRASAQSDAATDTTDNTLGTSREDYIAKQLLERGVDASLIVRASLRGAGNLNAMGGKTHCTLELFM